MFNFFMTVDDSSFHRLTTHTLVDDSISVNCFPQNQNFPFERPYNLPEQIELLLSLDEENPHFGTPLHLLTFYLGNVSALEAHAMQ